jgi:alcohol dehydrogenase class IV
MWYFISPQIIFGDDALDALDELEGHHALIVTDKTMVALGLAARVQAHLEKAGIQWTLFDAVEPEPGVETVHRGALIAREVQPDWIIGLGGGSTMDAAKAIRVLYERPDLSPADINPLARLDLSKKVRLLTIPTTSGTGSEATWGIVLSDPQTGRKMGFGNRENVADLAIVDPRLAASMPPKLTADTGLDALAHAIEGYTCTWHNDLTDGMCINAARLVLQYLPQAVADGGNMEARQHMHNAAACAGLGFGNAMASLAHALGHSLGAVLHLPHGRAVGLCLPYTVEFAAREAPERFAEMAVLLGISNQEGETAARQLALHLRDACRQVGSPSSLIEANIQRDAFEARLDILVEYAMNDTQMLTAPRPPTYEELRRLFLYIFDGKPVDF